MAAASARKIVAGSERLYSGSLHAGVAAARPLCLSAVRRRPAHLRRRAFRAGGGDAGAGKDHRRVPRRTARQGDGAAGRRGNDAAGSFADLPHHPPLSASSMAETGALFAVLRQTTDNQVADAIEGRVEEGGGGG